MTTDEILYFKSSYLVKDLCYKLRVSDKVWFLYYIFYSFFLITATVCPIEHLQACIIYLVR